MNEETMSTNEFLQVLQAKQFICFSSGMFDEQFANWLVEEELFDGAFDCSVCE